MHRKLWIIRTDVEIKSSGSISPTTTIMEVRKPAPCLGWRHFRFRHPVSAMQDGESGNAVCRTSVVKSSGHTIEVCPSYESSRPRKGVIHVSQMPLHEEAKNVLQTSDLVLKSIWSLASPSHYRNGWLSCPLATAGILISLHMSK